VLKILILLTFLLMLISLITAAGFLIRDDSQSRRLLTSLKTRVSLATILVVLLILYFLPQTK